MLVSSCSSYSEMYLSPLIMRGRRYLEKISCSLTQASFLVVIVVVVV